MDLPGKRVLVTGAAGGLGEVSARALAERGATLILTSRNREKLEQIAASLPGEGHQTIAADLLADGAVERVIEQAGEIDVLLANAGQPGRWALDELSADEVRDVIRINLEVPVQMTRLVIAQMRRRGSGQIVLVASLAGKFAMPESTMYCSTKAGLRAFAWSLRPEMARAGVGVTLISPGFVGEVGMFAKRGAKPPPGAGVVSPRRYTRELVRAIERNRAEAVIAPPQLRLLGQLALVLPGLFARLFKRISPRRPARQ
ncbi:MAG: SDR family NAD(P)-dependent oxidoreductase [Thermoleophilia bacterium]|nr:SDR family NAD(P)-dependent oxidoreductase [Thermoleophilia bacterium]